LDERHPVSDLSRAFQEDLTEHAHEVVTRLATVLRNAHVHGPNNESWQPLLGALGKAMATLRQAESSVLLEIRQGRVSVNRYSIQPSFGELGPCKYLVQELTRRGVGALRFEQPDDAEVKRLAYVFAASDPDADPPFPALQKALRSEGVRAIALIELEPETDREDATRDRRAQAIYVYMKGVAAVREILEGLREGRSVGLKRAKRFVQAALDLLAVERGLALSLTTIKNCEDYLYSHAVNVCFLCLFVGESMGLDKKRLTDLGLAALLRDVGEGTVPREILEKPGPLTPSEWTRFKRFPHAAVTGILRFRGFNARALRYLLVAFEHQFQGAQDRTLTARDFSLYTKVVLIAQAYDAMTTPRPYRRWPLTPSDALRTLVKDRGKARMDPLLLKVFVHAMGLYPVGSVVLFDTGEIGIVSDPPLDDASRRRPRVRLVAGADGVRLPDMPFVETAAVGEEGRFLRKIACAVDPWRYGLDVPRHLLGLP
jgi:HD-GYP domain-containing protein (c-di-GMP phosphodiesterase class II)